MMRWFLLALAFLFFLCALLVLGSAPTASLWIAAIVLGEWGHDAALLAFLLALIAWRWSRAAAFLALAAGLLCLLPAARALVLARTLPARCTSAFGNAENLSGRATPFSPLDLFRGLPTDGVEVSEQVYARDDPKHPLKLDLYRARDRTTAPPIILMIHGGSWNSGNKKQLPALNRYLAREGYAVASFNYRHAPEFRSPAQVEDVFRALDFLKANARVLALDPTRVVLIGRSAGGQIALSAAYAGRDPAIRGVVGFYAPSDLVLGYNHPSRRAVLDSQKVLREYLGGSPNEKSDAYAQASSINFVNVATPPTLLIHGLLDPIVWPEQSANLAQRLDQGGRPHLYLSLPWATHGCDANLSGPSGQLSTYAIDRFLGAFMPTPR
ncbi:MAG: alpha/beta hydrolase fold domain-containing protein [Chthoniobacterales bacterium]